MSVLTISMVLRCQVSRFQSPPTDSSDAVAQRQMTVDNYVQISWSHSRKPADTLPHVERTLTGTVVAKQAAISQYAFTKHFARPIYAT